MLHLLLTKFIGRLLFEVEACIIDYMIYGNIMVIC